MARFASIPSTVKAVFPLNGKFIKGTSADPNIDTKLGAISEGIKTTATSNNLQDLYAMHRLSPGDDIAFYNPDGDVSFAKFENSTQVPQEIFYPDAEVARKIYAKDEGGNPSYTNVTLFGGFRPKLIPLDQPFSQGAGFKPATSGASGVMRFSSATPQINFARRLPDGERLIPASPIVETPVTDSRYSNLLDGVNLRSFTTVPPSNYDSSRTGAFDRLPKQIADKVRQRKEYEIRTADTGFYKDAYIDWRKSPIPNQPGASPYFTGDLKKNGEYSPDLMAAAGYVLDDDKHYQKVRWENKGTNGGVIGQIPVNGQWEEIGGDGSGILNYRPVFLNPNYINYAFQNPEKYSITAPRSQYKNFGITGVDSRGNPLYKFQRTDIPIDETKIKASRLQNADKELYSVNHLIGQGRIGDTKEIYKGSSDELGYDQIQELARRGGSGRWVDDGSEDDYNFFRLNGSSSQADQMKQSDLMRGGGLLSSINNTGIIPLSYGNPTYVYDRPDLGYPTPSDGSIPNKKFVSIERTNRRNPIIATSTPSQHIPAWGGGIAINDRGIPVDTSTILGRKSRLYQNSWVDKSSNYNPQFSSQTSLDKIFQEFDNSPKYQINEASNLQIPNGYGWNGLAKAYQVAEPYTVSTGYQNLSPASELLNSAPQYTYMPSRNVRRLTEESRLPLPAPLEPYYTNDYGIIQSSANVRQIPLSVQLRNGTLTNQLASDGRWVGGGLQDMGRGRHANPNDPLNSNYQIRLPNNVSFKAELERGDPRVKAAWQQQQQALQQQTTEEKFIPYKKDYDLEYSQNQIPGTNLGTIEGAYLPALVEQPNGNFEPSYRPYTPNNNLLDQHLADVKIKLGNEYYPLTSEATTLQYLPSESQAAVASQQQFAKRKVYLDGRIVENVEVVPPDDNAVARAKDNSVYANPDIDGSLDIVGALDREQRRIRDLTTVAVEKFPYNIKTSEITRGKIYNAYNNAIDQVSQSSIMRELYNNYPIFAMKDFVDISPKYPEESANTLMGSALYGRGEGQNSPVGQTQNNRFLPNNQGATIGKSTSFDRIINEEEASRIQAKMGIRPSRKREVLSDDGIFYWDDIDGEGVYQKDLEGIVDNPNKKLSYDEVLSLLDEKTNNYESAKKTYTELMNLEPQDEIVIDATSRNPGKLSTQLQSAGLETEVTGNNVYARGSLTAGLPGENILNLPVQRFYQNKDTDEVINALVQKGKATKQIVDIANQYRGQLSQTRRMEQIGYPVQPVQYLDPEEIQNRIIQTAGKNAMLDRKADYAGDSLVRMLQSNYDNMPQLISKLPTETVAPVSSVAATANGYVFSPFDDPWETAIHNTQQKNNQPYVARNQNIHYTIASPKNPSDYTPEELLGLPPRIAEASTREQEPQQLPQPNLNANNNRWLKPGLIGAGVLGAAGLSLYYQQQQRQREEDERAMRAYRF